MSGKYGASLIDSSRGRAVAVSQVPPDATIVPGTLLWSDGTQNGAGGGAYALLRGVFGTGAPAPGIVYRQAPAGQTLHVARMSFQHLISTGTFNSAGGWGNGATPLTVPLRIQVVASAPTVYATTPVWEYRPAPSSGSGANGNLALWRSTGTYVRVVGSALAYSLELDFLAMFGVPLLLTGTQALRVVVASDTTIGGTSEFDAMISGHYYPTP